MDHIPAELWRRIFSFACTDDGAIGRSLSLASKYVRDASAPYRYQSIALIGIKQISSFLALLLTRPSPGRRVLYLYIQDKTSLSGIKQGDFESELCRILTVVAPSLRLLCLCLRHRSFLLSPIVLPALEVLMVYGPYKLPKNYSVAPGAEFRKLSRLHLQGSFTSDLDIPVMIAHILGRAPATSTIDVIIVQTITASAPRLTHLSFHTNLLINWEQLMREVETDLPSQEIKYGLSTHVQRICVSCISLEYASGQRLPSHANAYMRSRESLAKAAGACTSRKLIVKEGAGASECTFWTDGGEST
ncbi:hypothetical protein OE88DRAFT_402846 [Heliocybe sulcata]|uniref:F-box domain-containing protein n=1 Tax=Heliocybe sulcata TaxID=5364 RepID=A0A5C3MWA2_9AGAM|nr:hypothetical protein OE88DRAFT_402846 [Heliocybe sulcata]